MSIIASGKKKNFRFVFKTDRFDNRVPSIEITAITSACRQWNIDVVSLALLHAIFCVPTNVGRPEGKLMERNEQNARIVIKNFLRPIAVVYVPIDDHYALDSILFLNMTRRNCHIVE